MVNRDMRIFPVQVLVADPFIRRDQLNLRRDHAAHKIRESVGADIFNHAGDNATLALNRPDHNRLASTARYAAVAALILVTVLGLSAYEGFVNLNHAFQRLVVRLSRFRVTDAMRDEPSCLSPLAN